MPRPRSPHPIQALVTFDQAALIIGGDRNRVLHLIAEGLLTPHPYETDKIARPMVEDYALNYYYAKTNRPQPSDIRQEPPELEEEAAYGFRRA